MPVALRPLNTSLIRATIDTGGRTWSFEGVDADLVAHRVFAVIDSTAPELRPVIAAKVVEALAAWTGEAGSADELETAKRDLVSRLSVSLAAAYESETPSRRVPPPPLLAVTASAAPLPPSPTLADAREWMLTWDAQPMEPSTDIARTELIEASPPSPPPLEATPFERALLAFDAAPDAATLQAIAVTPVDAPVAALPPIPSGPQSGSVVLDVSERMGVRAVVVRNHGYADPFVYVMAQSEVVEPMIDRSEEIGIASLDEITALSPSRVEVWFESRDPVTRVPVVLVIDQFDVSLVEGAIGQWRQMTAPPDGEFIFDVTAARLRLRRVVLR